MSAASMHDPMPDPEDHDSIGEEDDKEENGNGMPKRRRR